MMNGVANPARYVRIISIRENSPPIIQLSSLDYERDRIDVEMGGFCQM
jgi:hypothetical protein